MMQAAVWTDYNRMEIKNVPIPEISGHEALIKVMSAGVCKTDFEVYTGMFEYGKPPHILGHEIAGIVEAVGTSVSGWKPGDRVVIETSVGCGNCSRCKAGDRHLCSEMTEIGFSPHQGGYAGYVKAPAENLILIPDNVTFDEAGILESVICPLGALMRLGVRFAETVLIFGAGPAAISFIQGAKAMGAGKIIVAGRNPAHLERTKEFGADILLQSDDPDFSEKIKAQTGGAGADLVCEAAGSVQTIALAFQSVRRAGRIIFYGIPSKDAAIDFPVTRIITEQLEIYGTVGNPHAWEPVLKMVSSGAVRLAPMVTRTMPLSEINLAFEIMRSGKEKPVKTVIHPWG